MSIGRSRYFCTIKELALMADDFRDVESCFEGDCSLFNGEEG